MQKQNGNSLLEILLVITVSSALIILAVRYFTVVDLNAKVAQAISRMDIIAQAGYQWLDSERKLDFSGVQVKDLQSADFLSKNDLENPWGGIIKVSEGDKKDHIRITLANVGPRACEDLRRHLDGIVDDQISSSGCSSSNKSATYWGEF